MFNVHNFCGEPMFLISQGMVQGILDVHITLGKQSRGYFCSVVIIELKHSGKRTKEKLPFLCTVRT